MLQRLGSYEAMYQQFRWRVPAHYNIGVDVCDKWSGDADRLALIYQSKNGKVTRYTFSQIQRLSNRTANLLTQQGLARGDRVAILLPQAPETAIAHVAVYKAGAIAVPLFTLFGIDALQYRLADSGAKLLITDAVSAVKLAQIRGAVGQPLDLQERIPADLAVPALMDQREAIRIA